MQSPLGAPGLIARAAPPEKWLFYRVFGLTVRSAFKIASLAPAEIAPTPMIDVEFTQGEVAQAIAGELMLDMKMERRADGVLLDIDEAGRFLVMNGREIVVEPDARADEGETHTYLLGSALGALLHQRGLLPLHANAVELNGRAFAFAGDSGAGKSTLAAYFQDRGYRLLSDDICLIDLASDGRLIAWPGIPRLKLWLDALQAQGRTAEGLRTVSWTDEKYEMPLSSYASGGPFELAAIYHLREAEDGRAAGIFPLTGLDAVNAITANTYRRRLIDICGMTGAYLRRVTTIVRGARLYTANRRWGYEHFAEEAAALERHAHKVAAS